MLVQIKRLETSRFYSRRKHPCSLANNQGRERLVLVAATLPTSHSKERMSWLHSLHCRLAGGQDRVSVWLHRERQKHRGCDPGRNTMTTVSANTGWQNELGRQESLHTGWHHKNSEGLSTESKACRP